MFNKNFIILTLIILLAAFLRFYQLGSNPPSLDWDEASLGYNAYSILKTGKDEFGRFLPISIRSFEDYKPAIYTYLTIPSVALFGLNEFSVRLPSAILGTLTVLITFFLVKEIFGTIGHWSANWQISSEILALLVSLFLAISPWHLQFSRVAFEANAALFFVTGGIWLFFKGLKSGKWLMLSSILFVISIYTYHSPRLVVPLILIGWAIFFRKQLWQQRKWIIISLFVGIILMFPFVKELFSSGSARLSSVTVVTPVGRLDEAIKYTEYDSARGDILGKLVHNRRIVYAYAILKGYLDHFNLDFLFLTGDAPLRHHAVDMGMFFLWEAPFILIGMLYLLRYKSSFPVFWWFLIAPIASAITTGTPHAVRALLYLPIYQIFTAVGLVYLIRHIKQISQIGIMLVKSGFLLVVFVSVFYYFQMYYVHSPVEAAKDWQYGYKQAVMEAAKYENQVDKIIMTYAYDQPHIYVLFYHQIDPAWYQSQWHGGEVKRFERTVGKYSFRPIVWDQDKNLTNVLLIGTPSELPDTAVNIVNDIRYPNGEIAFRIAKL